MTVTATELSIAGVVPLSTVDWPGNLVATVFLQGCPWACTYCHNVEIIDPTIPGAHPWEDVLELLQRRRGLLDGVVFTGGEALRQREVAEAISQVRELGFGVGLHTAGAYPTRLAKVLPLVDWVGLDIKALPGDYREVVGYDVGAKGWESLDIVLSSELPYEVRTTVHPGSPAARNYEQILGLLRERGVENFALQDARAQGASGEFAELALTWDKAAWGVRFAQMEEVTHQAGFAQVSIRQG